MEKNEQKISIIIKTYNSGETLVNTLESVGSFGEIIAIDEHSSDDTADILKEYRVKTIFADKNNLISALNQGLEEAKGDWIFILKDDEIIPKVLLDEIENYIKNPKKNRFSLLFNIKTFYLKKEIKSAKEKNVLRFFKKGYCVFKDNCLDLKILKGKSYKIKNNILRYLQNDISKHIAGMLENNKNISKINTKKSASVILAPIFVFIKFYFLKFGFLDGRNGFIYAKMKYISRFILEVMSLEKGFKNDI